MEPLAGRGWGSGGRGEEYRDIFDLIDIDFFRFKGVGEFCIKNTSVFKQKKSKLVYKMNKGTIFDSSCEKKEAFRYTRVIKIINKK